ncbi:hypothetical protein H6F42_00040 [Pseudanabaena sp. FACHB-1998]|uniref:hypothetical protein n=1 Tax=Pseudanabaena sp. FACHB-1998 TaxID=2692858 RepID=UPI0016816776|nr:hypothetical protein [Pseudanabaena sp. FACHB-1998]MBD2175304.1 hypothetical protein [Pseudanabaena sp. FACHB-1998]
MHKLITSLALTSTLVITQACSSLSVSDNAGIEATEQHQSKATNSPAKENKETNGSLKDTHPEAHQNNHGNHQDDQGTHSKTPTPITEAKLISSAKINPNTNVNLAIAIQDLEGKAIKNFEVFQEKLMHLIVVSDDLQFFQHLHPEYKDNGRFEIVTNFPQAGGYTLFSDYKPSKAQEQISVLKTQVTGLNATTSIIDFNNSKTFGKTKIDLNTSSVNGELTKINAGEEVTLTFDLQDTVTNQAPTDLQPYLGEKGHLVILRQSNPLTAASYIHAHALENTPMGKISFKAKFPQSGKYKLWGQFKRDGEVITGDFWLNVSN